MNEKNTLYIVVPCYKEQEVLPETSKRLREKMHQLMDEGKISRQSRVMFVNDGSSDNTWPIISQLHEQEPGPAKRAAGWPADRRQLCGHDRLDGCGLAGRHQRRR